MIADRPLLDPIRIIQAVIVYFWWMNLAERQPMKLAPFGCHCFYFRREHTRYRHGAGYFDDLGTILRRHWQDLMRGRHDNVPE
jgi:hypothetical protein